MCTLCTIRSFYICKTNRRTTIAYQALVLSPPSALNSTYLCFPFLPCIKKATMHCSEFPQQVRKCLICVYVYHTADSLSRKGFDWWMQILLGEILQQVCYTLSSDLCPEATQGKPRHATWKSKGVLWSSSHGKPAGLFWPQDLFRLKPHNERASSPTLKGVWPQGWWHQRVHL